MKDTHPHIEGTADRSADHPAILAHEEQIALTLRIEAGVFAGHLLAEGTVAGEATSEELHTLVQDGELARAAFFLANIGLVWHIVTPWAKRYGVDGDELFQEGCIGLGEAIQRFDPLRGCRFSTMAWPMIANRVAAAARARCGALEASDWTLKVSSRVQRRRQVLEQRAGRVISPAELAEDLGRPVDWVTSVLAWSPPVSTDWSLEPPVESSSTMTLDPAWLAALPREQREVITARFGLDGTPRTRAQVAGLLGIRPSQARRLEERGLARLREHAMASAA